MKTNPATEIKNILYRARNSQSLDEAEELVVTAALTYFKLQGKLGRDWFDSSATLQKIDHESISICYQRCKCKLQNNNMVNHFNELLNIR